MTPCPFIGSHPTVKPEPLTDHGAFRVCAGQPATSLLLPLPLQPVGLPEATPRLQGCASCLARRPSASHLPCCNKTPLPRPLGLGAHVGFSSCGARLVLFGSTGSRCAGFSACGAQALGHRLGSCDPGCVALQPVGSSGPGTRRSLYC